MAAGNTWHIRKHYYTEDFAGAIGGNVLPSGKATH